MSLSLSIIIPAYNEARRIGKTLHEIFAYLNEQRGESEVIVVDDGSRDETVGVSEEVFAAARGRTEATVIRVEPNRGKGHAVRTGLLAARAPVALFSDADLSTPITETPKLTGPIRAGEYDVVFGSRALDRSLIGVHQSWRRDEGGRIDRFGFDVELLYVAHAAGLRLYERPVRWDDAAGSKVTFRNGLDGFLELRELRRQARAGVYDEAIRRAREISSTPEARAPLPLGDEPVPSDA